MRKSYTAIIGSALALFLVMLGFFIGRNLPGRGLTLPSSPDTSVTNQDISADRKDSDSDSSGDIQENTRKVIDINTATKDQLSLLPGIGEALAERIVDYRAENGPFQNIEDLKNVNGIGEKKFNQLVTYIGVGG